MVKIHLVEDYHGSVSFSRPEDLYIYIGKEAIRDAAHNAIRLYPGAVRHMSRLTYYGARTWRSLRDYKRGRVPMTDVFREFNTALEGEDASWVRKQIEKYSTEIGALRLDREHIGVVGFLRGDSIIGDARILSDGCEYEIVASLTAAHLDRVFQDVWANQIYERDGRFYRFETGVADRKLKMLAALIDGKMWTPESVVFVGDDPEIDGQIIASNTGILPPKNFVFPPIAVKESPEKAEWFAEKGAVIAESNRDFELALRSLAT